MECSEIKEHCQPFLDHELSGTDLAAVQQHLDHCPACALYVGGQRAFNQLMRQTLKATVNPAPAALRARIVAGLRAAPAVKPVATEAPRRAEVIPLPSIRRRSFAHGPVAVAASFMLAFSGMIGFQAASTPQQCPLVMKAQHQHDAVIAGSVAPTKQTENRDDLTAYIRSQLTGFSGLPDLANCDLKPVGTGLLREDGITRGVFVKYVHCRCGQEPVTIIVMDTPAKPKGEVVAVGAQKEFLAAQQNGRNVVSWKANDGLLYMLVTQAPLDQALEAAQVASR